MFPQSHTKSFRRFAVRNRRSRSALALSQREVCNFVASTTNTFTRMRKWAFLSCDERLQICKASQDGSPRRWATPPTQWSKGNVKWPPTHDLLDLGHR